MMREKIFLAFINATFLLASAGTLSAQIVAYDNGVNPGNQAWTGNLGLDFDVNAGKTISITSLGAFDNNADGFTGTVQVAIYNRDTMGQVCGPVTISGTVGTLSNGNRFVALTTPCVLAAGHYSVVAVGFNATDMNYNTSGAPNALTTENNGGGLISFVGSARYDANTSLDFPSIVDGGPEDRYMAGTFIYQAYQSQPTGSGRFPWWFFFST